MPIDEKLLKKFLGEVSIGNYVSFQAYLNNHQVKELYLAQKAVGLNLAHLAASLINTPVSQIELSLNEINAKSAADLMTNLKGTNVTKINLSQNQIGTTRGTTDFAFIANLKDTNVIEVDLSYNKINADSAADLIANLNGTKVTKIDLRKNQIGAGGTTDFAFIANLKDTDVIEVNLSHNAINADSTSNLAANFKGTKVARVNLSSNKLGDQGAVDFIANLKSTAVTEVNLTDNQISTQGAIDLSAKLKDTGVTKINLSRNEIDSLIGTKMEQVDLSLYEMIQDPEGFLANLIDTKVEQVNLSDNKIDDQSAAIFIDNLKNTLLRDVNLTGNKVSKQNLKRLEDALIVQAYVAPYGVLIELNQNLRLSQAKAIELMKTKPVNVTEAQYALNIIRGLPPEIAATIASFLPHGERFISGNNINYAPLSEFLHAADTNSKVAEPEIKQNEMLTFCYDLNEKQRDLKYEKQEHQQDLEIKTIDEYPNGKSSYRRLR